MLALKLPPPSVELVFPDTVESVIVVRSPAVSSPPPLPVAVLSVMWLPDTTSVKPPRTPPPAPDDALLSEIVLSVIVTALPFFEIAPPCAAVFPVIVQPVTVGAPPLS